MKRFIMVLLALSFWFNDLAFAVTQHDLNAVILKWRAYPQFIGVTTTNPLEIAIANTIANPLVTFVQAHVVFEMMLSAANGDKIAIEDSVNLIYAWQDFYKVPEFLRTGLSACPTREWRDSLDDSQKRISLWIERIGVEDPLESLASNDHALEGGHALAPSLVAEIFSAAQNKIASSTFPKDLVAEADLSEERLREAQMLLLGQLLRSALREDYNPQLVRSKRFKSIFCTWSSCELTRACSKLTQFK